MIWQQPWAWMGAAAVLLPVLIHLLGVGRATRHRFPTLRFIQPSRLLPAQRTRIHDPWLLLLRVVIVLVAVAALAQPLLQTAERRASFAGSLARVVVLDTSASAQRATLSAGWGADSARVLSRAFADSADVSVVVETADVAVTMVGAGHWLKAHAMRREIVAISDFQVGSLDTAAIRELPAEIGLLPVRLGANGDLNEARNVDRSESVGGVGGVGGVGRDGRVGAVRAAAALDSVSAMPLLFTAPSTATIARAAIEATLRISAGAYSENESARMDRLRNIAIVSGDYPGRDSLLSNAATLPSVWMPRLLHEVRSHPLVAGTGFLHATYGERDGQPLLLLLLPEGSHPADLLPVVAAVYDLLPRIDEHGVLTSRTAELTEREQSTVPESVLRSWQREPAQAPASDKRNRATAFETDAQSGFNDAPSDARWLWALVLVLLATEFLVRRRMTRNADGEDAVAAAPSGARAA